MDTMWAVILAMSIPSGVTAFCFWLIERSIKRRDDELKKAEEKRQKELDDKEEQRKTYELCQLNMIMASMALAEATAKAVQRIPNAQCNGDMDAALNYANEVKNEQRDFLKKQAIKQMNF